MTALKSHRLYEREYLDQLDGIRWEIECQSASLWRNPCRWLFCPVVKDLKRREKLIKRALRQPILPPLPDELRNPFDIPPTPVEVEFLKAARRYFDGLKETAPVE